MKMSKKVRAAIKRMIDNFISSISEKNDDGTYINIRHDEISPVAIEKFSAIGEATLKVTDSDNLHSTIMLLHSLPHIFSNYDTAKGETNTAFEYFALEVFISCPPEIENMSCKQAFILLNSWLT